MTSEALAAAGRAEGLASALGYAPASIDADKGGPACEILRAAEMLYSRHALGLKWSQGTLRIAETAASSSAAEAAAAAAASKKKKSKSKSRSVDAGRGAGGGGKDANATDARAGKSQELALEVTAALTNGGHPKGGGLFSKAGQDCKRLVVPEPKGADEAAGRGANEGLRKSGTLVGKDAKNTGAPVHIRSTMWSKPEVALDADEEAGESWTWVPTSPRSRMEARKSPLPVDVRQLSR